LSPRRWAAEYHGKVISTAQARRLVQVKEAVALAVPERVLPFAEARDLVLDHPEHIVALDCPCRLAREHPCLPLDVCLVIGEPFASFVLSHHADHARAVTPEEAVGILEAEAGRGHVHHAFFKEAMAGRFYAVCNCCSCCCGAISAHRRGTPMLVSSGYVAEIDGTLCAACGICAARCPFGALRMRDGRAEVDLAACMGCGVCVQSCPSGALALRREPARGDPLEMSALIAGALEM
jgi:ferredoxin